MASCRIERKRAHDREAQRASRAKTKAYIAHLEKTVQDLTEGSGDQRANYLAHHASKQAQEIDSLQGLLNKIRGLVQDNSKNDQPSAGLKLEGSSSDVAVPDDASIIEPIPITFSDSPSEDPWEVPRPIEPASRTISSTRNLKVLGVSIMCESVDDTSYFKRLNEAITKVEQTPDNLSTQEEDEDILIRAITTSWDAAERVHHFDIVWRFLRAHDEGLWYRSGPLERLAHFWQMRSTMVHKIQPKNQERRTTTSFMAPTTLQLANPSRPPIIDYFGWPAVRNQLLARGIEGCSGKSSIAFAESFQFVWPYELRDVYKHNRTTGMYSFTERFLKSFNDITNYRMAHHDLIPYYCHPSLAPVEETDSDTSVDEEIPTTTDSLLTEGTTSTAHWSFNTLQMSHSSGPFPTDPWSILAQEVGLTDWSAT